MKITLLTVGKIKEKFFREAVAEYTKRLSRYCRLRILEIEDEKTEEAISDRQREQILEKEGKRILNHIKADMTVIGLAIEGQSLSSPAFADWISKEGLMGHSHLCFIIGGSLGLHPSVLARCDKKISFSAMTFPHQLMRVILLEQIYRAYRIIHSEPYHK